MTNQNTTVVLSNDPSVNHDKEVEELWQFYQNKIAEIAIMRAERRVSGDVIVGKLAELQRIVSEKLRSIKERYPDRYVSSRLE